MAKSFAPFVPFRGYGCYRWFGLKLAEEAEIIPENVGFAIRASVAQAFLDANSVSYRTAESVDKLSVADIAEKARQFTVRVECWR